MHIYTYLYVWGLSLIVVAKWPYKASKWHDLNCTSIAPVFKRMVSFYIWGHPNPAVWQESSCKLRFRFLLWLAAQHVLQTYCHFQISRSTSPLFPLKHLKKIMVVLGQCHCDFKIAMQRGTAFQDQSRLTRLSRLLVLTRSSAAATAWQTTKETVTKKIGNEEVRTKNLL